VGEAMALVLIDNVDESAKAAAVEEIFMGVFLLIL
jgi:hypothetical protein